MSLIQELARECFRAGKPLNDLISALVEEKHNRVFSKAKSLIHNGADVSEVREALVNDDDLTPAAATSLAFEAQTQAAKEQAEEAAFQRAVKTAQQLYANGNRRSDVTGVLISQGVGRDLAEKIARDNQHCYRP